MRKQWLPHACTVVRWQPAHARATMLLLLLRADDEADRQALLRQQNKVAALEAQLGALKVRWLWPCQQGKARYLHVELCAHRMVLRCFCSWPNLSQLAMDACMCTRQEGC